MVGSMERAKPQTKFDTITEIIISRQKSVWREVMAKLGCRVQQRRLQNDIRHDSKMSCIHCKVLAEKTNFDMITTQKRRNMTKPKINLLTHAGEVNFGSFRIWRSRRQSSYVERTKFEVHVKNTLYKASKRNEIVCCFGEEDVKRPPMMSSRKVLVPPVKHNF